MEMFSSLRTAVETMFGSVGNVDTFLVDFEQATIGAIQEVFLEVTVQDCTFHFRQAVMRHLQQEGLLSTYESTTEHPDVRMWMRRIMAMSTQSLPFNSAGMFYKTHHRRETLLWTPRPRQLRPTSTEP